MLEKYHSVNKKCLFEKPKELEPCLLTSFYTVFCCINNKVHKIKRHTLLNRFFSCKISMEDSSHILYLVKKL